MKQNHAEGIQGCLYIVIALCWTAGAVLPLGGQVLGWLKTGNWVSNIASQHVGLIHIHGWTGVEKVVNSLLNSNTSLAVSIVCMTAVWIVSKLAQDGPEQV